MQRLHVSNLQGMCLSFVTARLEYMQGMLSTIKGVKASKNDPIAKFMIEKGIPHEADVLKPNEHIAFKFPNQG